MAATAWLLLPGFIPHTEGHCKGKKAHLMTEDGHSAALSHLTNIRSKLTQRTHRVPAWYPTLNSLAQLHTVLN